MATERPKVQPDEILRAVVRGAALRPGPARDAAAAPSPDGRDARLRPSELEALSQHVRALGSPDEVVDAILDRLGIDPAVPEAQLQRIPARGPLVVVCNQAFGSVEALVMYQLLRRRRADVQVFANQLLSGVPQLHDSVLFVDPGWRLASRVRNVLSLKAALRCVDAGGAVGVLPLSETASFDREPWQVVDATWEQGLGEVIREAAVTTLPVRFVGNDDALRGLPALLQPVAAAGNTPSSPGTRRAIRVEIGQPLRASELAGLDQPGQATAYLRDRADILSLRPAALDGTLDDVRAGAEQRRHDAQVQAQADYAPIAAAGDAAEIAAEIAALPESQKLVRHKGRLVAYARGAQCPQLLDEIGRLRQVAFRAVGEGTPEPRDLDRFDGHYDHLFVWNEPTAELIGAYRLGRLDELPAGEGPYSSTLFEYRDAFFERLGPALELGRSFVRPEYQRSPAGLIMLWKGIGAYLCRNPRYRYLLGPVSMSADYCPASHQLMVSYMERYAGPGEWAGTVLPRTPFDPTGARAALWARYGHWCGDLPELSRWVSHLEGQDRTVPVLIKSYLGLSGRMLAFNVDPDFGDCIDGLVLVDLTRTPVATLEQFMGAEQAHAFLSHHPVATAAAGAAAQDPAAEGPADPTPER